MQGEQECEAFMIRKKRRHGRHAVSSFITEDFSGDCETLLKTKLCEQFKQSFLEKPAFRVNASARVKSLLPS
jgi:hypothetical protein